MASTITLGPGKTSPRIHEDFLDFDPLRTSKTYNILTDPAPILGEANTTRDKDACRHDYAVKVNQSRLPPLDLRPDESTLYQIAVVCRKCRLHAVLTINYQYSTDPCPNSTYPLHHFQRVQAASKASDGQLRYTWQCSSPNCAALLDTVFTAPRLQPPQIVELTDTSRLKKRYDDILKYDPEREGIKQATPVDSLSRLRKYIRDALNPTHTRRTFPANNKRFMEAFGWYGGDCRLLLENLGFRFDEQESTWTLPNPPMDIEGQSDGTRAQRAFLEDIEIELLALVAKLAKDMNLPNPNGGEEWKSADRELERTLAAQGYPRSARSQRATPNIEAYCASLGALPNFADSLIEFCYERQSLSDPEQQPYYFECLREIAHFRNSDSLLLKFTMLESQGCVTRNDLREAYQFFDLPTGGPGADDDRILNLYQAQLPDLSSDMSEKARAMLFRIGSSRGSKLLVNAAQQSIETVEEALMWLGNGVDKTTSDDMLITVFALRTDSDPAKEELGRKAISVIAKARDSMQLTTWLETGRMDGYTMSTDEALRHLDITDSLDSIDGSIWPSIFDNARQTRPGAQTDKAIAAIQQALAGHQPAHKSQDWPVGLTSLGNTCYLNSLLQYYFSIKPLRDIVLDYDNFKFDLSAASEKAERVGQRQISLLEIKGGQKFAEDLKHLFERMISDPSTSVKPEQDLVCRAFLDPKDSDLWDNKDRAVVEHAVDDTLITPKTSDDGLVAEPVEMVDNDQQVIETFATEMADDNLLEKVTESPEMNLLDHDSSTTNHITASPEAKLVAQEVKTTGLPPTPPASPGVKPMDIVSQAPPLPPRRFSTTTNAALERAQSNATQQQDVTEVHDGIQFRLRAGLHSQGHDESGEQLDELLELFSIGLLDTPVKDGSVLKSQLLRDSAIQLNVPTETTDLYSALDAIFDQQPVEGDEHLERYKSIARLPPFLQINIPRVGFNKEKGEQFKSEHTIKLLDELYLDRYFDDQQGDLIQRRRNAWGWRRRLAELKKESSGAHDKKSGIEGPEALAQAANYIANLRSINVGLEELGLGMVEHEVALPEVLSSIASQQASRLNLLTAEAASLQTQLTHLFHDLTSIKYRLQAVFFHRGKSAHGHYWICIRDFHTNTWRRYNDERVELVPDTKVHEILEATDWSHGTPTYAVYVKDDLKTEVVQPVCRHVENSSPEQTLNGEAMSLIEITRDNTQNQQSTPPGNFVIEGGTEWDPAREVGQVPW